MKKCKGCKTVIQKGLGFNGYCSSDCRLRNPKLYGGCKPACKEQTIYYEMATYRNGAEHAIQKCTVCLMTRCVPKSKFKVLNEEQLALVRRKNELTSKYGDSFYTSTPWLSLRYKAFVKYGRICQCCGTTDQQLHVDHIVPRSRDRSRELDINNLQVLCRDCNLGKSNNDSTDFRSF